MHLHRQSSPKVYIYPILQVINRNCYKTLFSSKQRRMLLKLLNITDNAAHPLHNKVSKQHGVFSQRLLQLDHNEGQIIPAQSNKSRQWLLQWLKMVLQFLALIEYYSSPFNILLSTFGLLLLCVLTNMQPVIKLTRRVSLCSSVPVFFCSFFLPACVLRYHPLIPFRMLCWDFCCVEPFSGI